MVWSQERQSIIKPIIATIANAKEAIWAAYFLHLEPVYKENAVLVFNQPRGRQDE